MDLAALFARFDAAEASSERPKAAQLRDIFDRVERMIRAGVRYATIINILADAGLKFTYNTFAGTLKRIRRERGIFVRKSAAQRAQASALVSGATVATAPVTSTATVPRSAPVQRPAAVVPRASVVLPEGWQTAKLTPDQLDSLTHDQQLERRAAILEQAFPNPYKDAFKKKNTP
ncbi:hypothetical protein [Burkholderia territorii]|uniref:hypothetical protein n=1 Tax=Burkholderia territorii TaxID=1503055 RepID=UPI0009BEBD38|nr:hypothetical protein [Burkholderia territorii]